MILNDKTRYGTYQELRSLLHIASWCVVVTEAFHNVFLSLSFVTIVS